MNVNGVGGVSQTEIHTAKLFVQEPDAFEAEVDIEKLKRYKLPSIDQIPAELIQAGEEI
jgi:hypothetical protein